MVWFKVDDKFHSSVEVMSIPATLRAGAIGLWTLAGAWSCDQLKDGAIPGTLIESWGGNRQLASALVKATLWERVGRNDYQFRNWDKWQPTRAAVLQKRAEVNERVKSHRSKNPIDTGPSNADVTRYKRDVTPPPSRPDPTKRQTPTSSVSNAADDQSYPQPSAYAELIRAAKAELEAQGNEDVDKQSAMAVVDEILERGGKRVRNPTAYVHRALTGESGQGWVTFAHGGRMPE